MIETGEISARPDLNQFVAIEVYETDALRSKLGFEPALDENQVRVSLMAGSFANDDTLRPEFEKHLGDSTNENRIRVHFAAGYVFHEIGFQQYGLSTEIELEQPRSVQQGIRQGL